MNDICGFLIDNISNNESVELLVAKVYPCLPIQSDLYGIVLIKLQIHIKPH